MLLKARFGKLMNIHVYILRCADGSYYVGISRYDLERRVAEHNAGTYGGYTARRRPVVLIWAQDFDRLTDAIHAERQLKGWRREKKEALMRGDADALRTLSRRYASKSLDASPSSTSSE